MSEIPKGRTPPRSARTYTFHRAVRPKRRTRELLHDHGSLPHELSDGNVLFIQHKVLLRFLSGFPNKDAKIRTHSRIEDADIRRKQLDLLHRAFVDELRREFLLRRNHDTIARFDPERRRPLRHSIERMFDLHELSAGTERRQRKRIGRFSHSVGGVVEHKLRKMHKMYIILPKSDAEVRSIPRRQRKPRQW